VIIVVNIVMMSIATALTVGSAFAM
jgi:hypothetical protein